jgi:hypothetical protein
LRFNRNRRFLALGGGEVLDRDGQNATLRRPFSVPGSGWHARTGVL